MPYPCCCTEMTCSAEFSWARTTGLSFDFTDLSNPTPTSWSWNFGGDGTSTAQNPSHTFSAPGAYFVTLTVTMSDASECSINHTVYAFVSCADCYDELGDTVSVTLSAMTDNICEYCDEIAGGYLLARSSACEYTYGPVEIAPTCQICDAPSGPKTISLKITATAGSPVAFVWVVSIIRTYSSAPEEACNSLGTKTYSKDLGSWPIACTGAHTLAREGASTANDCNDWPATVAISVAAA